MNVAAAVIESAQENLIMGAVLLWLGLAAGALSQVHQRNEKDGKHPGERFGSL